VAATPEPSSAGQLKQLGRYAIVREIGRGGMGVVYLATDPIISRPVALKTITFPPDHDERQRAQRFERFAREARAAGILSHPGIVTVYDAGRDDASGLCFIAMEYVAGHTLKQEIADQGALPEGRTLELARRIALALDHAHGRGIVHRDLKPANILLGEDGSIKIADFGVARMETSDLTRDGQSIGSPAYMSPEQALGRTADRRSDLFSFGVVIYEMLTGRKPFTGPDTSAVIYQIVHEKQAAPSSLKPHLSPAWDRIVARLASKRPEDRYADARALLVDLEALVGGLEQFAARSAGEDSEETVFDANPAQTVPGGQPSTLTLLALREMGKARDVARGHAASLMPRLRSLHERFSRLPSRRRVALVTVGLFALILMKSALGLWAATGCPVDVELKHGLESGRLRIDLDDETVVDRRFHGEQQATQVFGKDFFKRTGGTVAESFVAPPGVHQISVRVQAEAGGGDWSQTVRRTLEKGERATLVIRVGTAFSKSLRLDWETAGKSAAE
jgi:predicted Ser/Thr protein kinase